MNVYPEGGMNLDWDLTYIVDGKIFFSFLLFSRQMTLESLAS